MSRIRHRHHRCRPVCTPQSTGDRRTRCRARCDPYRRRELPRCARRQLHPQNHPVPANPGCRRPTTDLRHPLAGRVVVGHSGLGCGQEHREHGDRPQCRPRAMGLDERPRNPLDHLGVGHGRALVAVAVLAQLPAPHVHQRPRRRRRPRVRHHAGESRRRVAAAKSRAAVAQCSPGRHLRVGYRPARPAFRPRAGNDGCRAGGPNPGLQGQDQTSGHEGLRCDPGAQRVSMAPGAERERGGQRAAQPLGVCGDLLRTLSRRRREVHGRCAGPGEQARLVPASDAGQRQLPCRTGTRVPERQPVLPDRTPPVSRPAEQPLRPDRAPGAGLVRDLPAALHHGIVPAPVRPDAADDPEVGPAGPVPAGHR